MEPNGGRNTFVYDVLEGLEKQISSILAPLEDFDKRYLYPSLERSPLPYCLTIRILEGMSLDSDLTIGPKFEDY